jgi:hypothetical protein
MVTVAFDTLKFANRLKEAGVPGRQAEAEAEALAEALQVNLQDLVTRRDLLAVRDELKSDARDLETRLRGRMDTLEVKLTGELTLIKWMLGMILGGIAALILKAFF